MIRTVFADWKACSFPSTKSLGFWPMRADDQVVDEQGLPIVRTGRQGRPTGRD